MGGVAWNHHLLYSALNTCIKIIILALLFSSVELTLKDVKMKVLIPHSCLTLWDLTDCSSPGSSVHGILQARILESVAISFSEDLPDPGIEPGSPALAGRFFTTEPPGKPICFLAKAKLKKTGLWAPVFTGDLS